MSKLKENVAKAALEFIEENTILGVGTGSTVNYLIQQLPNIKNKIDACVASSKQTEHALRACGLPVIDLNVASEIVLYIDGADEVTSSGQMIKGGGGAHTREKILASVAKNFLCIVDESKVVEALGHFPVAVEVIPMARSFVARELVKLGGDPEYRDGFFTDNGNIILDVFNLNLSMPIQMEERINLIPGVVENGIFAKRLADSILVAEQDGVKEIKGK